MATRNNYSRPGQCLFCQSRKCYTRIFEPSGGANSPDALSKLDGYDEACCPRHVRDLEIDADDLCPRAKMHVSSSETVSRHRR